LLQHQKIIVVKNTFLSERITKMSESATLAMTKKSREMKATGVDVINLSIGEPDFFVPDFIKAAAKKAVDDNFSFYPPVAGYPQLRQAISNKLKRDNGLKYTPEQIVVSTGAKQAICNVFLACLDPGDEVIVPAPYWVSYTELIKLAGGVPVYIPTSIEDDFKVTPEQVEKMITPKTKRSFSAPPTILRACSTPLMNSRRWLPCSVNIPAFSSSQMKFMNSSISMEKHTASAFSQK